MDRDSYKSLRENLTSDRQKLLAEISELRALLKGALSGGMIARLSTTIDNLETMVTQIEARRERIDREYAESLVPVGAKVEYQGRVTWVQEILIASVDVGAVFYWQLGDNPGETVGAMFNEFSIVE